MPDYKAMYLHLFREVTRVVEQLQEAQREKEEMYMMSEEEDEQFSTK